MRGTVYHAAQAAGVSRQTVYRWRYEDREFADQLQIRFDDGSEFVVALKDEARAGNEAMIFEFRNALDSWQMLVMHIV
jgi:hypothetical protein